MATEAPPQEGVQDVDFIAPEPTPQQQAEHAARQTAENEELLAALQRGDVASFSLWLQKSERELGVTPDPVAHANLLVRAALLLHAAREDEHATTLLVRAVLLFRGRDAKEAANAEAFLRQVGGEKGIHMLTTQQRRVLRERNTAIQKELIDLGAHDSEKARTYTKEGLAAHTAQLRAELQSLIDAEQKLP